MKKKMISVLCGCLIFSCLAGCNTKADDAAANNANAQPSQLVVQEQAFESGSCVSAEEQEKEIMAQREATAKQYSIYSQFGLTYDGEKDRFFYDEKMVRYFSDKISEEHTNAFYYADGVIDLNPVRDTSGNLTGLTVASDEEFANRTAKHNELEAEFKKAGVMNVSGSFEQGNPDEQDNTLDAYLEYGVSYDVSANNWMYNSKPIHFFYDADNGTTYLDYNVTNGLNLKTIRDEDGHIVKFEEMTDAEVSEIIN